MVKAPTVQTVGLAAATARSWLTSRAGVLLCAAGIALACAAAYSNSLDAPFLYDDQAGIVDNPAVRSMLGKHLLSAPAGSESQGRPLTTWTLAVNYKLAPLRDVGPVWTAAAQQEIGTRPRGLERGYHLGNLLIHIATALALMGVVRRTLLLPRLRERFGGHATALAAAAALLWAVHPLGTQAVTWLMGRGEQLMALLYLLTLYAMLRSWESPRARAWSVAAVVAAAAGMAAKEVMVTAPLMMAIFEKTMFAQSWRELLRRRWKFYAALAATWIIAAAMLLQAGSRGGTAWVVPTVSADGVRSHLMPWQYLASQCGAVLHYLWLAVWPQSLSLDCSGQAASSVGEILPGALALAALAAATVVALRRNWPAGVLGAWLLAVLAPTSSIVPLRTLAAEHRMYLPLAAVTVAAVLAAYALGRAAVTRRRVVGTVGAGAAVLAAAAALGLGTHARNGQYASDLGIWQDAVAKCPQSAKAHLCLGLAYHARLDNVRALNELQQSVALDPAVPTSLAAYADVLAEFFRDTGNPRFGVGAKDAYSAAIALREDYFQAYANRGAIFQMLQNPQRAEEDLDKAIALQPGYLPAYRQRMSVRLRLAKFSEAWQDYNYITEQFAKLSAQQQQRLSQVLGPDWMAGMRAEMNKATGRTH